MKQFLHIKNLDKYHPGYKDRKDLKWGKLYFTILHGDPEFEMITEETDKWRYIAFIILELQIKKPVPLDDAYLTRKGFNLKKRKIALTLQLLQNFVEVVTEDLIPCILDKDKDKDKEEEEDKDKRASFRKPTIQDIFSFCKEKGIRNFDPDKFWNYYESKGWLIGKTPMKSWQSAIATWMKNSFGNDGFIKEKKEAEKLITHNVICTVDKCKWEGKVSLKVGDTIEKTKCPICGLFSLKESK